MMNTGNNTIKKSKRKFSSLACDGIFSKRSSKQKDPPSKQQIDLSPVVKPYPPVSASNNLPEDFGMIPLFGDKSNLVDRYDCRLLITEEDIRYDGAKQELSDENDKVLNRERYLDLPGSEFYSGVSGFSSSSGDSGNEKEKCGMSSDAHKGKGEFCAQPFSYDDNTQRVSEEVQVENIKEGEKEQQLGNIDIPASLVCHLGKDEVAFAKPWLNRQRYELICRTAKLIAEKGAQMEILVKTKQKENVLFNFLYPLDPCYGLYQRLVSLLKDKVLPFESVLNRENVTWTGKDDGVSNTALNSLATYESSCSSGEGEVENSEGSSSVSEQEASSVSAETLQVMRTLAGYVAKNGEKFEKVILAREGQKQKFSFLHKTNPQYKVFKHLVEKAKHKM